jgi:hypothetical protein
MRRLLWALRVRRLNKLATEIDSLFDEPAETFCARADRLILAVDKLPESASKDRAAKVWLSNCLTERLEYTLGFTTGLYHRELISNQN